MLKQAKVVMLPTKEKAKFGDLILTPTYPQKLLIFEHQRCTEVAQHLYILSDEEIKEWEYGINPITGSIFQLLKKNKADSNNDCDWWNVKWITGGNISNSITFFEANKVIPKKIIAATNHDTLIFKDEQFPPDIRGREYDPQWQLPKPSIGFIKVFIEEYNKGNIITEVMVEYNFIEGIGDDFGYKSSDIQSLKINPKDNTITIRRVKDSWNREEVVKLINKISEQVDFESATQKTIDKWIEENL